MSAEPHSAETLATSGTGRGAMPPPLVVRLASLAGFLLLWSIAAALASSRLFPSPSDVFAVVIREAASGALPWHLGVTLARVAASFAVAMAIGIAIGYAMGRSALTDQMLDPLLILALNIPALVVIILAYIWIGLTEAAAIAAVAINKIPNVAVTIREGARALDRGLDDMAAAFRMPPAMRLRHVVLPQLQPYLAAATRSGIALIWKIVLVVELLGRSSGVGFQLNLYFQLFDVAGILAYTLSFVAVMLAIELLIVQPIETHATRWRIKPA